jgi:hypothetical protein
VLDRFQEGIVAKEFAGLDCVIYSRRVHSHNSAGANVQMTDFAVAHLPGP